MRGTFKDSTICKALPLVCRQDRRRRRQDRRRRRRRISRAWTPRSRRSTSQGRRARRPASDLLSQLEHSVDAKAVLISKNKKLLKDIKAIITHQKESLSRQSILNESINNTYLVKAKNDVVCNGCILHTRRYAAALPRRAQNHDFLIYS